MRGIGSRWMTLFVLFIAAAVVLGANGQTPDPNAPDVRQRDGGHTVRRGDSLSKIAKRYGIADWQDLQVTSNGYSVQVDDSMPGGGGDLDCNDAILTVVIK